MIWLGVVFTFFPEVWTYGITHQYFDNREQCIDYFLSQKNWQLYREWDNFYKMPGFVLEFETPTGVLFASCQKTEILGVLENSKKTSNTN